MYGIQRLERSQSSVDTSSSDATIQHNKVRSFSTSSLSSIGSLLSSRQASTSRRGSLTAALRRSSVLESVDGIEQPTLRLVNEEEGLDESIVEDDEDVEQSVIHHEINYNKPLPPSPAASACAEDDAPSSEPKAFQRWLSTLRRKRGDRPSILTPRTQRWTLDDFENEQRSPSGLQRSRHQKSDSHASSAAFVKAVMSATATIASTSMATFHRRGRSQQHSSVFSGSDPRPSIDTQRSVVDEAARQRSRKRREKLQELVRTEEGYLADLKALSNALLTLMDQHSQSQSYARNCASTTIAQLIDLHDRLLRELRCIVPFAEFPRSPGRGKKHNRWYSVDGSAPAQNAQNRLNSLRTPRRSLHLRSSSGGSDPTELCCAPAILVAVAQVFDSSLSRFSEYNDYGRHYELMRYAVDQAQHLNTAWVEYDNAMETLAYTLNPMQSRDANQHKALTIKDLLIKPIQRLPRYLLLLNDLQKLTPPCDDPVAREALDVVILELGRICGTMNEAKQNDDHKRLYQTTWLLGDRLNFHNQLPRSAFFKLLGQVSLCGCLHIAYRSKDCIKGCYVICLLFETTLLLATVDEDESKYSVLAGIALANATIANCDNGKGLQCHTAPHSWKIVYEHHVKMYELVFTACSAIEGTVWREKLGHCISEQAKAMLEGHRGTFELYSPLAADMRSAGKATGKAGSFIRRMSRDSLRRAATVANTINLSQVIIKNTQAVKEALDNSSKATLQMPRSQSVVTPSHFQTLAPRRADRVRLEALLSEVWTKELLPYPGMAPRRSDPIRASANHVMRKFSMASITSNFSTAKRNASYGSVSSLPKEDMPPAVSTRSRDKAQHKHSRPPLVDFHNAPEAFLPEDFDLNATKRKRSAFRTFTMSIERPFSPMINESKSAGLRRTQSVHNEPAEAPAYAVVQERADTPAPSDAVKQAPLSTTADTAKTPRKAKSMNRLLRLFG